MPLKKMKNWQLITKLCCFDEMIDVRKINMWVNALGKHIQTQSYKIDISGAFAIAKQSAFNPIGTSHQRQFGGGHRTATVIMWVQ